MRIGHLIFSLNTGGTETMLVDILNQQAEGHAVALFIVNDEVNEGLLGQISDQVKVTRLNRKEGAKNPMVLLRLNRALSRFGATVIHCHHHKAVNLLRPSLRKRTMLTLHTTQVPVVNLKKYGKLFAISEAVRKDAHDRCSQQLQVVHNGIDVAAIAMRTKPADPQLFRIVQVGRLNQEVKGQHILFEALKILKDQGIANIRLDLVGDGPSMPSLVGLRSSLGLNDEVRFLGARNRQYIYQRLQDYDLLVQPSFVEGFGLTIVEAAAAGLPVLVSDLEGPMEIIKTLQWGDSFTCGNVRSLADGIAAMREGNAAAGTMSALQAREAVRRHFDIHIAVSHYLKAYETIK
ncbi:glycosyltransferase [Taibaiella koreensis]|uniref:glycosyltransferase n=1 Tax=Taibaiella koreensis TaxID=1268548 RepID=UPI000E59A495|nr:glycosyltransferase [Taibaiella koreensis]